MKRIYLIIVGLAIAVSLSFAFSSGPLDNYCGNPPLNNNCTQCHNSFPVNSGNGTLQLEVTPTYVPGTTYTLIVSLSNTGQSRWGFELTPMAGFVAAGTLVVTDTTHTQLSDNPSPAPDFLKHTRAGTYAGITTGATWDFQWVAPPAGTGTVTFYVAGNAANNSATSLGDYIYTITRTIDEVSAVAPHISLPTNPQVLTNYPNPFNPLTTLTFSLNQPGAVQLSLYDVLGRQIESILQGQMSAGPHSITLNASSLASGTYVARLVTPQGSSVRVLNLVK